MKTNSSSRSYLESLRLETCFDFALSSRYDLHWPLGSGNTQRHLTTHPTLSKYLWEIQKGTQKSRITGGNEENFRVEKTTPVLFSPAQYTPFRHRQSKSIAWFTIAFHLVNFEITFVFLELVFYHLIYLQII